MPMLEPGKPADLRPMTKPAVFLDRDDTLVVDAGFIDHPDKVTLVTGAIEAVRRLRNAGYRVVVASNQSGVARGYFDEARLDEIHDRLQQLLAAGGAYLDGIYYCPFLDGPEATVEAYRRESDLRKPAPGMLVKAAKDLDLDLEKSWMVGDSARDIEAGQAAGCRTILITANGEAFHEGRVEPTATATTLLDAVSIIEGKDTKPGATPDDSPAIPAPEPPPARIDRHEETAEPEPRARAEVLLTDIRNLLERQQRDSFQEDFSLTRLLTTLLQMLALFIAGWGVLAMFGEEPRVAAVRFALAGFLQLLLITFRLSDRRR